MLTFLDKEFKTKGGDGHTLHLRLLNAITNDIQSGRLDNGMKLPGTRTLSNQLGINRKTVQLVYEELEAQGWLTSEQRMGTFVSHVLPDQTLLDSDKRFIGSQPRTKSASKLITNLYAEALELSDDISVNFSNKNDGIPDARLIPYHLLARTYRRVCVNLSRHAKLGYGDPRGAIELRNSLKKMLINDRFIKCSIEEICVVRGSQMGIYLASRVLNPQQGAVIMEDLCYLPAQATFEGSGFEILKCRLDNEGLDILHLEQLLEDHDVAGIFVTPHHQYPTTVSLPMYRRLALLELSKTYNFMVIEDDYDHEFHYGINPLPPLASLNNSENVVHIGSMSKVFAPGLRLGYIVADNSFITRVAQEIVLIDRQGNTITEHVLSTLMESGEVKRHIRKVKLVYKDRRDHACAEFLRVFGDTATFNIPTGGLAIWVDISKLVNQRSFSNIENHDSTLSFYFTTEQTIPTHLRFGFGSLDNEEITQSIQQLFKLLN